MAENGIDAKSPTEEGRPAVCELEGFEISPQQRRIWLFQHQDGALYARITLQIQGALDPERLRGAAEQLAQRHEILRTYFQRVPGRLFPVQVVQDTFPPQWQEIDLQPLSPEAQAERVQDFLHAELPAAFCVEKGPLFRVALLRLSPQKHLLSLCLPSLCADMPSLHTLAREMMDLYAPEQADLNPEPLQYADLADWQNQLLENQSSNEAGHAYWRQQGRDAPAVSLAFEKPLDPVAPFATAALTVVLDPQLQERLRDTAQNREVRPAAILAACWQAVLCRLSGGQEAPLLYASDGRPDPDLREAVGPLARWLPLNVGIDPSIPIGRLWRRLHTAIGEATHWQHYWKGGDVTPEGETDASAPIGFAYDVWPGAVAAGSVQVTLHSRYRRSEPLPLELACLEQPEGLSLAFSYEVRRYSAEEIRRLASYYQVLLESALLRPEAPLGALNLLPPEEREQVLVEWNRTEQEYPQSGSVPQLFEAAALAHPEALALVSEDQALTYDQLNRRANQLAHSLRAKGVGPEVLVGLYGERSLEMVVGLLGILKAGGAYLPLDPTLPQERLQGMLQDSGAHLVVTAGVLADLAGVSVVRLDAEAAALSEQEETNPACTVTGEDRVYVIYTSGSTGRPKGVEITHRNLLNYVLGVRQRLGLRAGASYAMVSTLAADLGHTMLFPALCGGGCLHVVSAERAMDAGQWRAYLGRHRIDCLKIVPSHLSALLGRGEADGSMLPGEVLVLGGEASAWELVERIGEASPGLRIFNHYGPTETTVGVLTYAVEREEDRGGGSVPLGRPLPNSQVYVLNSYLQPVPVGVAGEIYIGGLGVGRGYLHQAELTGERFVRDPFGAEGEARLYRSGDLGRHLPDGKIEFLGRVDHQVKVRGFRIELGEIESVLRSHGSVRDAVVLALEERGGDKRLVGYVVGEEGPVAVGVLREHLLSKLPGYMVPSALMGLSRLPLTANGKVDRAALSALEVVDAEVGCVGPSSALETVLLGIWEEFVPRAEIGVDQNFFDLGGHSLLATQVISRVRETFEVDVPLRTLFDAPTVSSFASAMLLDVGTRSQIERMSEMLVSLSGLSEEELEGRLRALEGKGADAWN